ncbi:unnamed protein product [Phyllotreta striolata]|uniref:Phosphatidic acid phosphatase type 2/haloperoxidase domain-containing protein n=1 Tax=Phyllotreta striolata TaxID=444603 RepID=A0A9N9TM16_PHYSR|nr:unnamed protein product [Phyllotreta striolata]
MSEDVVEIHYFRILFEIIIANLVGWSNYFVSQWATPYRRGLFCDDQTIRYPYKDSTVKFNIILLIGFGLNGITMLFTEYLTRTPDKKVLIFGRKFPFWCYSFYRSFAMFTFGDMILWGATDSIKYLGGRLRPHFFVGCLPDVCFERYGPNEFYENYKCMNEEQKQLRLSFPSGHTCFSIYCMVYFALYIHTRISVPGTRLLKFTVQYVALMSAVAVSMTRISDYKHHVSDVIASFFLGLAAAVTATVYASDLFNLSKTGTSNNSDRSDRKSVEKIHKSKNASKRAVDKEAHAQRIEQMIGENREKKGGDVVTESSKCCECECECDIVTLKKNC